MRRLRVDPPGNVLDLKESVLMAVSSNTFNTAIEDLNNDRLAIEWTNIPRWCCQTIPSRIVPGRCLSPTRCQQDYRSSFTIQTTAALSTSGSTGTKTSLFKTAQRLMRPRRHALSSQSWMRWLTHVSPTTSCRKASELCYDDTVKTLKELFGHNTSVFARRYNYLRTQRNGESLSDYTGMVNRRHEMAEFNAITPEQMKRLVWICGLHTPDDADIRTLALRKMEDNPQTTEKGWLQHNVDITLGNAPTSGSACYYSVLLFGFTRCFNSCSFNLWRCGHRLRC
ncbi:unnamed protein product [Toxocara canis]|uniref:Retrotrans_gag domain-containing protein n=1 Tax=Toxocara canis TaxID=6265 RepID=A0A183V7B6_TOXCA|nr:unnamed protein product [Toxocara canis]